MKTKLAYRANFLWPHKRESVEEAGYEFVNGLNETYRKLWWKTLVNRIEEAALKREAMESERVPAKRRRVK